MHINLQPCRRLLLNMSKILWLPLLCTLAPRVRQLLTQTDCSISTTSFDVNEAVFHTVMFVWNLLKYGHWFVSIYDCSSTVERELNVFRKFGLRACRASEYPRTILF
jgi:hypothetical protein